MILEATARYPMLQIIGAIVVIIGGVVMMIGYHGTVMHLPWFTLKLILIALIILNQLLIGRPAMINFRKILSLQQVDQSTIMKVKKRLLSFNGLQLFFFLLIFILSSFRFG
ncbi:hypothetical protein D3C78_1238050 [compost metagenome]